MKRASPTYRMALEIVSIQLAERGLCLTCPLCNQPIRPWELAAPYGTNREHMIAMAYDPIKYDRPWNMRIAHVACAQEKTNGKRTIGKLGGDNSEVQRAVRLANGGKKTRGPKIPSRPFPKPPEGHTRKIQNRPFGGRG